MSTLLLPPAQPSEAERWAQAAQAEQPEPAARGSSKTQVRRRSRVYLPAFSVAALAVTLIAVGWIEGWGGSNFAGSVTLLRVVLVGPLALAMLGCFMVTERIWPAQQRPLFARGHRHDLMLTVMEAPMILVAPLVTALTLTFVELVRRGLPWIVLPRIGALPRWGAILAILVVMDFCNWAVHLANHRVRLMWRFHELHHSQEDMNVLTVFRTHPLIHVSYLAALIPGVVLLSNGALSVTVLILYGGMVAFAHSNTRAGFGPLERVFVSPNFHRIHHQLNGPQDVNLGFALTIWDQMFHRAVFPTEETIRTDTGLPGRPLIVEQEGARPHHFSVLLSQLVAPFRPMRDFSQQPLGCAYGWSGRRAGGHGARTTSASTPRWVVTVLDTQGTEGDSVVTASLDTQPPRSWKTLLGIVVRTRSTPQLPADCALLIARIVLAWIFIYYGGGKLFGWFNEGGIHATAIYFSQSAHLHPGGLFAVLGGVIEFFGAIAVGLGLFSRLAGIALFGDMVMAMITVTWATGINSRTAPPGYQLNLALAGLALVVTLLGSGRFSLDAMVERSLKGFSNRTEPLVAAEPSRPRPSVS